MSNPKPVFKLWFETDDGYVFGPGIYSILKKVDEFGTLKQAATSLGMSYRYAWGMIKKAEIKLGEPLILMHKGGSYGGGGAKLSDNGKKLLTEFNMLREKIYSTLHDEPKIKVSGIIESITSNNDNKIINIIQNDNTVINIAVQSSYPIKNLQIGKQVELEYYIDSFKIKN
ncbi:LysR family transcriptional regulator [Candidatus Bathyarchaeota archaeon]|nr:LysR family transcriptional regulator [Candidatus Bathyarchaeota archaeon]